MNSILQEIRQTKIAEAMVAKSLQGPEIEALLRGQTPPRGFLKRIHRHREGAALIAEVKKASPSEGVIRADFDAVEIARTYERAGAQCLSVLTDQQYFQGSAENLMRVREAVSLPLLRKDFIVDEFQIRESRAYGADAVLLIAAILTKYELEQYREIAEDLGMDALVEVHNEIEAFAAIESGARLIGVNNRDLDTFETDLSTSERLFEILQGHATLVSESALRTHEDVRRVTEAGASAVLIGTTFCRAPDIEAKVHEVMGR